MIGSSAEIHSYLAFLPFCGSSGKKISFVRHQKITRDMNHEFHSCSSTFRHNQRGTIITNGSRRKYYRQEWTKISKRHEYTNCWHEDWWLTTRDFMRFETKNATIFVRKTTKLTNYCECESICQLRNFIYFIMISRPTCHECGWRIRMIIWSVNILKMLLHNESLWTKESCFDDWCYEMAMVHSYQLPVNKRAFSIPIDALTRQYLFYVAFVFAWPWPVFTVYSVQWVEHVHYAATFLMHKSQKVVRVNENEMKITQ